MGIDGMNGEKKYEITYVLKNSTSITAVSVGSELMKVIRVLQNSKRRFFLPWRRPLPFFIAYTDDIYIIFRVEDVVRIQAKALNKTTVDQQSER